MLDLLQHRVGDAVGEDVARQQQHRQAVDMSQCCGRDHVDRAGADRRGGSHDAAAEVRLGVAYRRMRHRLLIVGAEGRQLVAIFIERLADAGDIAMAEDRPDAAEQRQRLAVDLGLLARKEPRQRLRHRQANGLGHDRFLPLPLCRLLAARGKPGFGELLEAPGHVGDRRIVATCVRPIHCSAASLKMVRPTAKPLTIGALAVAAKAASSSCCGASSPSSTTPRHHGSLPAITASIFCQADAEACGSSFHQSGLMPSA